MHNRDMADSVASSKELWTCKHSRFSTTVRRDRTSGARGGGVAVFVRSGLKVTSVVLPSDLEAVCVQLHLPKRKQVYVAAIYRPPSGGLPLSVFISRLDSALDNLPGLPARSLCVVGDFNAKSSCWWNGQETNDAGAALESLAVDHGLVQVVDGPTRCVSNASPSQLDLMFINNVSLVESCAVLSPVADHSPTLLQLRLGIASVPQQKCHQIWDFDQARWDDLDAFFQACDWSPVLSCTDVNQALQSWNNIVQ